MERATTGSTLSFTNGPHGEANLLENELAMSQMTQKIPAE